MDNNPFKKAIDVKEKRSLNEGVDTSDTVQNTKYLMNRDEALHREQEESRYVQLDYLFEKGQWKEFLECSVFNEANLTAIPIVYFEKGLTCAAKLLDGVNAEPYVLSVFQNELMTCRTVRDFMRKWKKGSIFDESILAALSESSMCNLSIECDKGLLVRIMNEVGQDTKPNDTLVSLIPRFELCKDRSVPYLYLMRLFASKSKKTIEQCVTDYCRFIKNLNLYNNQIIQKRIQFNRQVTYFQKFIDFAYMFLGEQGFSHNVRGNILSVFFDIKRPDKVKDCLTCIDKEKTSPEWILVELMESETWEETQIEELFKDISLLLVEKCIAVIWSRFENRKELPEEFLALLSWVLKYSNHTILDEIIRITYPSGYNKRVKQISLLNSLSKLIRNIDKNEGFYLLASYGIYYVYQDFSSDKNLEVERVLESWNELSGNYFSACVEKHMPLSSETEESFIRLFSIFHLDYEKEKELQTIHGKWYVKQKDWKKSERKQVIETLHQLYQNGLFAAFQFIYEKCVSEEWDIEVLHEQYFNSLIYLGSFRRAIRFAYECEVINQDAREKYIVKALKKYFSQYGLSEEGTLLFDDIFTIQEAIKLLNRHFNLNDYSLVLSLIMLYVLNDELIKSVYLYSIYRDKAEIGHARVYAKFKSRYMKYFSKIHNHYDVIEVAFNNLSQSALLSFIEWASKVKIPGFSDYLPSHVFSVFYDDLLKNANDSSVWKRTFKHIINTQEKKEMNAWLICVCSVIMAEKFNMPDNPIIKESFVRVLNDASSDKPRNMLYFLCKYILKHNDVDLCSRLGELLKDTYVKSQLLGKNPWSRENDETDGIIEEFSTFCKNKLQETGNTLYLDIITNIKEEMTERELLSLSHYSMSKNTLIKRICQSYLDVSRRRAAMELLNADLWQSASYQEKQIHYILTIVYDNDFLLLAKYPELFTSEEDLQRFKQDCIRIIGEYPSSNAFLKFSKECINLKHKLVVYSFMLGIFYNDDIYHNLWFDYEFIIKHGLWNIYLKYLGKCYEAQLAWNQSYLFEYKTWRYLKLLMLNALDSLYKDASVEDDNIIYLMNVNGHYERLISEGYNDFKTALEKLLYIPELNIEEKSRLIFGLISEDFSSFCQLKESFLYKLSEESADLLKRILSFLNYRDVNEKFYHQYLPLLDERTANDIIALANTFSNTVSLSIKEWLNSDIKEKNPELFKILTLHDNTSGKSKGRICLEEVLNLDKDFYISNNTFINAVIASKELPGRIFDRLRLSAIGRLKGAFDDRFEPLAYFLKKNGYKSAMSQYYYLIAIRLATERKHTELNQLLENKGTSFLYDVPFAWRIDSSRIVEYAQSNGIDVMFKPNDSFYYSVLPSIETKEISFIKLIFDNYKSYAIGESKNGDFKLDDLKNEDIDIHERIERGVQFFLSEGIDYENMDSVIKLGLLITSKEAVNITAAHKLCVLTNIFRQREVLSRMQKDSIFENFNEIYHEFTIDLWIDNYEDIVDLLSLGANKTDIEEVRILCKNILEECPEFNENYSSRANEVLYSQLKKIVYIGSSPYVHAIKRSSTIRLKQIEEDVRLSLCIENIDNLLQDGCVYCQIKNNGHMTIDLRNNCKILLSVTLLNGKTAEYNVRITDIEELRAGWITGCKQDISNLCNTCVKGDLLDIKIELSVNDKLITRDSAKLKIAESVLPKRRPYESYCVEYAVGETEEDKLYGREIEQEDIAYAIGTGKTVIYGPSRIGKTSLMNWVRNNLAEKKGNVITLLFGGERDNNKATDYKEYFYDDCNHTELKYKHSDTDKSNSSLSEYLLVDTLKYGLFEKRFGRANFSSRAMENKCLLDRIAEILSESNPIRYKYRQINDALSEYGKELWLLFDEFQQVLENWKMKNGDEPSEFFQVCECLREGDLSSIKLVLCGSDELLRQMVLVKENTIWREKLFNKSRSVRVGPLKEVSESIKDPFKEMLREDKAVKHSGIVYSDEALNAVGVYSARVPLYAKEICNTVLEAIADGGIEVFGRNVIYTYDIAKATQNLIEEQNKGLSLYEKDKFNTARIVKIFDAVTKGLDKNTDKQYLWYIAKWFYLNPDKDRFPLSEFTDSKENSLLIKENQLRASLKIAKERGIISGDENNGYVFSTVFYHNAFSGTINGNLDESRFFETNKDVEKSYGEELEHGMLSVKEIVNLTQKALVEGVTSGTITAEQYNQARMLLGNNTWKMIQNQGGSVAVFENSTINNVTFVQKITNNLKQILLEGSLITAEDVLMPSLEDYIQHIPVENRKRITELRKTIEELSEAELRFDSPMTRSTIQLDILEKELELERLVLPAERSLTNDCSKAVLDVVLEEDVSMLQDDYQIINLEKELVESVKQSLPTKFHLQYEFAILLHKILYKVDKKKNFDFCPIALMYCKLIEGLLKEYHAKVYSMRLSDRNKVDKPITVGNRRYYWGDFLDENGNFDSNRFAEIDSTMGNFTFHIGYLHDKKDISLGIGLREQNIHLLSILPGESSPREDQIEQWKAHTEALMYVYYYRNNLAHNLNPISRAEMDEITRKLFNEGEFKRIIELAQ